MIYQATITTDANTTAADPKETSIKVLNGLIYKVVIQIPPGPSGLVGVQIYDANYQLYPTTNGEWFTGDNIKHDFDDIYYKKAEPYFFQIKTYNTDDTYEHKVIVQIGMVSEKVFMARFVPSEQYEIIKEILNEIVQQQEELKAETIQNPFPQFTRKE